MSRVAVFAAGTLAVLILAGCSGSSATSAGPSGTPHGSGCVSQDQAKQIWTQIDTRLNAIELDPKHRGVSAMATGQAEITINHYLQQQLEAMNFTEREVDRLDSLVVENAACDGGELQLRVTETVVQDDYLRPAGTVDHSDPSVGQTVHLLQAFVRAGSSWKEAGIQNLDEPAPTSTPQVV